MYQLQGLLKWILILVFLPIGASAQSVTRMRHVVFDLDWTLINETTADMATKFPKDVLYIEGKYYRLTKNAVKKLIAIHQEPNVAVSFFSGGGSSRNQAVVDELYRRIRDRVGDDRFRPHLVLSKEHLQAVSQDLSLKFSDRWKKNLEWFFDLKNTLIIEDVRTFVPKNQKAHLIWLGKTYNDRANFYARALENQNDSLYSAPSYQEWYRDQNKLERPIERVLGYLRKSFALNVDLEVLLKQDYNQVCSHLF